jgi:hypothetical protein
MNDVPGKPAFGDRHKFAAIYTGSTWKVVALRKSEEEASLIRMSYPIECSAAAEKILLSRQQFSLDGRPS